MPVETSRIRNFGIVAHIDAGKTTTTERILFYTNFIKRMGEVDEGTATTDWYHQERKRGISIFGTTVTIFWRGYQLNLIDTPGHIDFTAEVERALRVMDSAVVVFCGVGGVEAQSETVWRQAEKYDLPRLIYVNKLDRVGSDYYRVLEAIKLKLNANVCPVTIPVGEEENFAGVIDLISMQFLYFEPSSQGTIVVPQEIPEQYQKIALEQRNIMLEKAAEFCEPLMEKLLTEEEIKEDEIKAAIRVGTIKGKLFPSFAGASLRNIGVQPLIDGICDFSPSPVDRKLIKGFDSVKNHEITIDITKNNSLCALVFKTTFDKHGELAYLRIYSGELHKAKSVFNPRIKKMEKSLHIYKVQATEKQPIISAGKGEIVAVAGLKHTLTGDTLCEKTNPVLLESIKFPETVAMMSVEPVFSADRDRLIKLLEQLQKDDPTLKYHIEKDTDQIIISGMGELHLEVTKIRIIEDFNIPVNFSNPRVSYRETIQQEASVSEVATSRAGDTTLQAGVSIKILPDEKSLKPEIVFELPVQKQKDASKFIPAIKEGIQTGLYTGNIAGYPLVHVKVIVNDIEIFPTSTEGIFTKVANIAVKKALSQTQGVLLEPCMRFEVTTPIENMGDVITDLGRRNAKIREVESHAGVAVLRGYVALSKMFGYITALRSLTSGQGSCLLEPYGYEPVPEEIVKEKFGI